MKNYNIEIAVMGYFRTVTVQANNQVDAKKAARSLILDEIEALGLPQNSRFKYNSIITH